MEQYDIIIIGAGPGGLTAGIYAGRQGTKNLIIDRDLAGGIGREVPEMENYPGFESISGLELIEKMTAQAIKNCDLKEMEEFKQPKSKAAERLFMTHVMQNVLINERREYDFGVTYEIILELCEYVLGITSGKNVSYNNYIST